MMARMLIIARLECLHVCVHMICFLLFLIFFSIKIGKRNAIKTELVHTAFVSDIIPCMSV